MKKGIFSFTAVVLIIAGLCMTAIFGVGIGDNQLIPSVFDGENGIRRGLDLVGGSTITYEAEIPEGFDITKLQETMEIAQAMMRLRLTSKGFTEAAVSIKNGDRLYIEIPDIKDPEEAVRTLGTPGELTFRDSEGNVVLNGDDIKKATPMLGKLSQSATSDEYYISLELVPEAVEKFRVATADAAAKTDGKNYIEIAMDGIPVSMPSVSPEYADTGINSSDVSISGNYTSESAKEMADIINIGRMPFNFTQIELRSIGPQLGEKALSTSLFAAAIGIILVALFMMIMYRVPGFIASISLAFYISLVAIILTLFRVNLSLPGIAGIILSIGMAVDANVIIFERIKEELNLGKTVKSSIKSGFSRAFSAIFDSNVTTLIAAVVLYYFGTGPIVGFAITLGIGVVVSMFTALTVTHFLLNRLVDMKIKNPKFYGIKANLEGGNI